MIEIDATLLEHGGDPAAVLRFDVDGPELLPYATLTAAREAGDSDLLALLGVYEWQERPLLVLVDGSQIVGERSLARIRRLIAMRGDAPYLAVVGAGTLSVYRVGFEDDLPSAQITVGSRAPRNGVIPYLANRRPGLTQNRYWISDVILKLLSGALDRLVTMDVPDADAISLVGRALFVRFLADRNLLPHLEADELWALPPHELFDGASRSIGISGWLDKTFNGDFLPLSAAAINALPPEAFSVAGDILRRAPDGQLSLGWDIAWDRLDFAHIPVGVLSQSYERYLSQHEKKRQRDEGSYYTPRHIADLMVRASFAALRVSGSAHSAKVLDPAAGAGVFLITAFRQLVAERWKKDGKRPETHILRQILYTQITGFDINESALRFAALGLYLMSIELDPHPEPVQKLGFKNLRPTILRKLGATENADASKELGSLGEGVGDEHLGAYDLVIGNPPWARGTGLKNWDSVEKRVLELARLRLNDDKAAAPLPGAVLDLPFVWRAMEWARPNGQVALALHARILFQRGSMEDARAALFSCLDVTGVINGTDLRQTRVWPEVQAPFCLLFARNTVPAPGAGFRFVTPRYEETLNHTGAWRIDVAQAELVTAQEVRERPEILKLLFRGSRLDVELYDRIILKKFPTFGELWATLFGGTPERPNRSGIGYKKVHRGTKPNLHDGRDLGYSSKEISHLPVLPGTKYPGLVVDSSNYPTLSGLGVERLDRPRDPHLYRAPLLLINECPPVEHARLKTSVAIADLAFNQSYHGYSAATSHDGMRLVEYLALALGSKLSLWFALVTSGRFGFERPVVEKMVVIDTPVPPFDELSRAQKEQVRELFHRIAAEDREENWRPVDDWFAALFGMGEEDVQIITDTLAFNLPDSHSRRAGQRPTTEMERRIFSAHLHEKLLPWMERFNRPLRVELLPASELSPWCFVYVGAGDHSPSAIPTGDRSGIVHVADEAGATEVTYVHPGADYLLLGRLNQARYWSLSQAKLAERRLVWQHMQFLAGPRRPL